MALEIVLGVVACGIVAFLIVRFGRRPQPVPQWLNQGQLLADIRPEVQALVVQARVELSSLLTAANIPQLLEKMAKIEALLAVQNITVQHNLLTEVAQAAIAYAEQQVHATTVKQKGTAWTAKDKLASALDYAEERCHSVGAAFRRGELQREIEAALGARDRQKPAA